MSFYPPKVNERFRATSRAGVSEDANANGTGANFACGSYVKISLRIDSESGAIVDARFRTNGCGFMVAASDVVCEKLGGKTLADLHGLRDMELMGIVANAIGEIPLARVSCAAAVFDALRSSMSGYRERLINEFQGEKALICTCFGVSEETIMDVIANVDAIEVDEVSDVCRAGSGCGSCRMLIQELIDAKGIG